jgi:hypothetical protein
VNDLGAFLDKDAPIPLRKASSSSPIRENKDIKATYNMGETEKIDKKVHLGEKLIILMCFILMP